MLFAGVSRFANKAVIALRLLTTWAAVDDRAVTLDAEKRASAAVATVLKLKRIIASVFGWKLSD
jgi:hypothetical protein